MSTDTTGVVLFTKRNIMMNRFNLCLVGVALAFGLTACSENAAEKGQGAPQATTAKPSTANVTTSTASTETAQVAYPKDKNGCPAYPKEQWLSEADAKAKVTAMGYTIKEFKVSGNCFEVYGKDQAGKNAEVYFDAKTMAVVKIGD